MNKIISLFLFILLLSCSKSTEEVNYHKGKLLVATDPSFVDIVQNLSYRYTKLYPDADVNVLPIKEREGLKAFMEGKYSTVLLSRPLTTDEKKVYKQLTKHEAKPGYFAADALVFVVSKGKPMDSISVNEIKSLLTDGNNKLILNGSNSSNTDYIAQRLKLNSSDLKFSTLESDESIINYVAQHSESIGIIGLNVISRPYGKQASLLREKIKILRVSDGTTSYLPSLTNLKSKTYPFTRLVYFLTNESGFGISHGFIRYAQGQAGQLLIERNGLQPYYLFPRRVRIVE